MADDDPSGYDHPLKSVYSVRDLPVLPASSRCYCISCSKCVLALSYHSSRANHTLDFPVLHNCNKENAIHIKRNDSHYYAIMACLGDEANMALLYSGPYATKEITSFSSSYDSFSFSFQATSYRQFIQKTRAILSHMNGTVFSALPFCLYCIPPTLLSRPSMM